MLCVALIINIFQLAGDITMKFLSINLFALSLCDICLYVGLWQLAPTSSTSLVKSMQMIKNPVQTCDKVYSLIQNLTLQIRQRMEDPKYAGNRMKFTSVICSIYCLLFICVNAAA